MVQSQKCLEKGGGSRRPKDKHDLRTVMKRLFSPILRSGPTQPHQPRPPQCPTLPRCLAPAASSLASRASSGVSHRPGPPLLPLAASDAEGGCWGWGREPRTCVRGGSTRRYQIELKTMIVLVELS